MIRYTDSCQNITAKMLDGFFVGWPKPPSQDTHLKILKQSDHIELAIDEEQSKVVGFINAISDGVLSAYLPLLEVLPEYQHRGIGKELLRKILSRLDGLYMIDLVCDEGLKPFYESLGMKQMIAMSIRNFEQQCGKTDS